MIEIAEADKNSDYQDETQVLSTTVFKENIDTMQKMALFEEHLPDATIFSEEHGVDSVKRQLAQAVKIMEGPQ